MVVSSTSRSGNKTEMQIVISQRCCLHFFRTPGLQPGHHAWIFHIMHVQNIGTEQLGHPVIEFSRKYPHIKCPVPGLFTYPAVMHLFVYHPSLNGMAVLYTHITYADNSTDKSVDASYT